MVKRKDSNSVYVMDYGQNTLPKEYFERHLFETNKTQFVEEDLKNSKTIKVSFSFDDELEHLKQETLPKATKSVKLEFDHCNFSNVQLGKLIESIPININIIQFNSNCVLFIPDWFDRIGKFCGEKVNSQIQTIIIPAKHINSLPKFYEERATKFCAEDNHLQCNEYSKLYRIEEWKNKTASLIDCLQSCNTGLADDALDIIGDMAMDMNIEFVVDGNA